MSKASELEDGENNEVYGMGVCFPRVTFPLITEVAQFHGMASFLQHSHY